MTFSLADVLNSIPSGYRVITTYEQDGLPVVVATDEAGRRCRFMPDVPAVAVSIPFLEYLRYDFELLKVRDVNTFLSISSQSGQLRELCVSLKLHDVRIDEIDFLKQGSLTIQLQTLDALARGTLNRCLDKKQYVEWRTGLIAFIREQLDRHGVVFPAKK